MLLLNKEIIVIVVLSFNFLIFSYKIYNEYFLSINFKFKIVLFFFVVEVINDFVRLLIVEKRNLLD